MDNTTLAIIAFGLLLIAPELCRVMHNLCTGHSIPANPNL
jgi:hypothetical protein